MLTHMQPLVQCPPNWLFWFVRDHSGFNVVRVFSNLHQNTLLLCSRAGIVPPVAFKSRALKGSEDTGLCTREAETTEALGRRNWKQREQQLLVAKRRAGSGCWGGG